MVPKVPVAIVEVPEVNWFASVNSTCMSTILPVEQVSVKIFVVPIDAAIQSEATDFLGGLNTMTPVTLTPSGVSAVLSESRLSPETPEFQETTADVSVDVLELGHAISFLMRMLEAHGLKTEFVTVQTPPCAPIKSATETLIIELPPAT